MVFKGDTEIANRRFKLAAFCSVFQAELLAIREALNYVENQKFTSVILFSDARSALQALSDVECVNLLISEIQNIHWNLTLNGTKIQYKWVRGHAGIVGNERADQLAKSAAISHMCIFYDFFPLTYAKRKVHEKYFNLWNERYLSSETGSTTKIIFPDVKSRQYFDQKYITFDTAQVISGHGGCHAYLNRMKLRNSNVCPCNGTSIQDMNHLLKDCDATFTLRREYLNNCELENLLPWPPDFSNRFICHAFFQYATSIVKMLSSLNSP